ncbi:hypothetical protein VFPPC_05651 [Pochonia chlamydosporia 170]|uniref:DUF7730 domain-containing protein n=1 Tax=Pochonia chlamydosporia 170 TaxID=1380566 RepID=A0A179FFR9_METCM|nr:hypothetical protein VFPPC_05651 [Pochonia chlamydosporia 170]OAQ64372.1 hypothetical protein VFPPC_05651 [Pochonia chlamydosporia 170]
MDPQLQSCLFHLPVEIRRHIFSYIVDQGVHVYLNNGRICISTCVTPQPSDDYFCFDRRSSGDPPGEVWARRLDSPWALHWRCEEVALRLNADQINLKACHDATGALMQSCRRVYGEIASLTAEKCVLHITDLTTLDQLLNGDDKSPSGSLIDSLPKTSFSHVRKLNLTFRLTLQDYKMIELQAKQPISLDHLTNKPPVALWMDIWAGIAKLKHLQSLHLYLDHDSQASWTLVNEAAILTPLLALSQNPNLRTTISIPALPPQDTQTNTPPLSLSPLNIKRFTRQRFFTEQRQDGTYGIVYEDDANSMFHDPGPSADELARTAEMTMHAWLHGIELDYLAMDEDMGGGC